MRGFSHLTARQRECLEAVCTRRTRAEAADALYMTRQGLGTTLERARKRLGADSTAQACYLLGQFTAKEVLR
jgi:DNA-binding CsgD family transcriptional regulator